MTIDPDDFADQVLPLGGPYDPDAVRAAAGLLSELVRRLNHATFGASGLPYPSSVDRLVGSLNGAVAGLPQLLQQLAGHLERFAADPNLYADADAQGREPVSVVAGAVGWLERAGTDASAMADGLGLARQRTARLGIREVA